jgi:hypothetical protein
VVVAVVVAPPPPPPPTVTRGLKVAIAAAQGLEAEVVKREKVVEAVVSTASSVAMRSAVLLFVSVSLRV